MTGLQQAGWIGGIFAVVTWAIVACAPAPTPAATLTPEPVARYDSPAVLERDPDVPDLPFPDNPDPTQCGIPIQWGKDDPAWLTGYYQGKLVQPTVFLYDSHFRRSIAGAAPSGTEVRIKLYQQNPVLDFYLVRTTKLDPPQEGWVPGPFLQFEPLQDK